jgi:hypothetical protein
MSERFLDETRAWVELAVIGLGLCPFAKAPQAKGQVRYALCEARDAEALLEALVAELELLAGTAPERIETTLLVHPHVLADFADHNDFLDVAEAAVAELGLEGAVQVASFHPRYRFAGSDEDDVTNATNRSPWPTLHLLREESVERAVAAFPEAEAIYEANIGTLRRLGAAGWGALQRRIRQPR